MKTASYSFFAAGANTERNGELPATRSLLVPDFPEKVEV